MKKVLLIVSPLVLVAACFVFLKMYPEKLGLGSAPPPIPAINKASDAWAEMTNHVFTSLKDRDALRSRMNDLISVQGASLSSLQREKLVESSSGILYGLGTGDWEVYQKSRFPFPMQVRGPEYKHEVLCRVLKVPESETNRYTLTELHQKFVEQFKTKPFLNSGLLLSSNTFTFGSATQLQRKPNWNEMPSPGVFAPFRTSETMDYEYSDFEKKELEQQGKILWGFVNVVGEGNPDGTIRPYRLEYIWNTDNQCWIPTTFVTANEYTTNEIANVVRLSIY